jgi:hypothetical protein
MVEDTSTLSMERRKPTEKGYSHANGGCLLDEAKQADDGQLFGWAFPFSRL